MKMLKICTLLSALLIATGSLFAQVSEGVQPFAKKESGNALTISVEGQAKNVAAVLDKKLKAATSKKGKSIRNLKSLSGGMKSFGGARYPMIASGSMDYTYRVEKVKGSKENSVIHFWVSTGNNNFIDSDSYPDEMAAATEMLEGLQYEITVYEFDLMIAEQEKVTSNAVKTHEKLVKDSIKLQDQLAKILDQIEKNKVDRAEQLMKISDEENKLAEFRVEFDELKNGPVDMPIDEVARTDQVDRSGDLEEAVEEVEKSSKETKFKKKDKNDLEEEAEGTRESLGEVHRGQTQFDIVLVDAGKSKFSVIKEIKSVTGLSMGEAKKLVDASADEPVSIMEKVSADEAEVIKAVLEEAGAKIELK